MVTVFPINLRVPDESKESCHNNECIPIQTYNVLIDTYNIRYFTYIQVIGRESSLFKKSTKIRLE